MTETKTEARGVAEAAHQASVTDTKASAELAVSSEAGQDVGVHEAGALTCRGGG